MSFRDLDPQVISVASSYLPYNTRLCTCWDTASPTEKEKQYSRMNSNMICLMTIVIFLKNWMREWFSLALFKISDTDIVMKLNINRRQLLPYSLTKIPGFLSNIDMMIFISWIHWYFETFEENLNGLTNNC